LDTGTYTGTMVPKGTTKFSGTRIGTKVGATCFQTVVTAGTDSDTSGVVTLSVPTGTTSLWYQACGTKIITYYGMYNYYL
jgi:hypothetical protein